MAAELISQRINALANDKDAQELRILLNALIDGIRAVCDILDTDAGVTATNTKSTFDAVIAKQ